MPPVSRVSPWATALSPPSPLLQGRRGPEAQRVLWTSSGWPRGARSALCAQEHQEAPRYVSPGGGLLSAYTSASQGAVGGSLSPVPCLSVPRPVFTGEHPALGRCLRPYHRQRIGRDPLALKRLAPSGLCSALGEKPGPGLSPCPSWLPAGHDSDSDSELSLDEQSSSYASSHSSDSEDDGLEAEDKWDPARGPVHSTPKGEGAGTAGQDRELGSVKGRPGGGVGREGAPTSPPTEYRHECFGGPSVQRRNKADPTCYGESEHKAPRCWGAAGGIAAWAPAVRIFPLQASGAEPGGCGPARPSVPECWDCHSGGTTWSLSGGVAPVGGGWGLPAC